MQQMHLPDVTVYVTGSDWIMAGKQGVDARHDKKVDAAGKRASEDGWKGFVNVDLTADQKTAVKALALDASAVWAVIFDLVDGGYKLTITYDRANGAYVVSMTAKAAQDVNAGLTLTARGGSVQGACASFVYKHSVVLEGDWTSVGVAGGKRFGEDDVG